MKTRTTLHCQPLPVLLTLAAFAAPSAIHAQQPEPASTATAQEAPPADVAIAQYRRDLLHHAWQAASALPVNPHVQTRSRVQEKVVLACLELQQPELARVFLTRIADWRRGACMADYAQYCAVHGAPVEAERFLKLAEQVAADFKNSENPQEWQRDTILQKLARTYARLGNRKEAERFAAGIDPTTGLAFDSGFAATAGARADLITADDLGSELSAMDDLLVNEASGLTFSTLVICTRLFDRFYGDVERRDMIEKRIRVENAKLPPNYRMTALIEVGRISLRHDDREKALDSLRKAQEFLERTEWTTDVRIAFVAQLAAELGRAGKLDEAKQMLDAGLASYQEERETFRGTKRAEILRPFAEAWHAIGDDTRAAELYTLVIEEGMENPNSRPRAEDISDTCVSMALQAFEPTRELLLRIREVVGGLGDPW